MDQCSESTRIRMFLGLSDPHLDLLVRGTDPRIRIRIRTNMSRIPHIDFLNHHGGTNYDGANLVPVVRLPWLRPTSPSLAPTPPLTAYKTSILKGRNRTVDRYKQFTNY
jgi:hypothetical protein